MLMGILVGLAIGHVSALLQIRWLSGRWPFWMAWMNPAEE